MQNDFGGYYLGGAIVVLILIAIMAIVFLM